MTDSCSCAARVRIRAAIIFLKTKLKVYFTNKASSCILGSAVISSANRNEVKAGMEERKNFRRPVRRVDISINMEKTGANIRRLIKASGYSVRDIMAITGISTEQAVYKWYRGESIPAIETMLILTNALGIDIKELLVIDGEFDFAGNNTCAAFAGRDFAGIFPEFF